MTLHHITIQFLIYLKALGLSAKRLNAYQKVLADVEAFYGAETALDVFDDHVVLEYVRENDPFETDPVRVERGVVFCKFTHWLMKNKLIPAWANEMAKIENEKAYFYSSSDGSQFVIS